MGFSLKKAFKKIGKIVSAPVRGVGHALKTSHIPIVSNIGSAAEHVGNAVAGKGAFLREIGKAGQAAAPVAGLIPGVGTLAGAAIGAGGTFLNKGTRANLGDVVKYGGAGALSGYANQRLLGGRGILGVPKLLGAAKTGIKGAVASRLGGGGGGIAGGAHDSIADYGNAGAAEGGGGGIGGFVRNAAGDIVDYIKHNPLKAAQIGLAGLNVLNAAKAQGRANAAVGGALGGVNAALRYPGPALPPLPPNPYGPGGAGYGSAMRRASASLAGGY